MRLLKFDGEYYLLDNEKPSKGDKFLILYEDESYGEIAENTVDDFNDYADEDWTDECHKVIASTIKIDGLPTLDIENINKLIPVGVKLDKDLYKLCSYIVENYDGDIEDKSEYMFNVYSRASKILDTSDKRENWDVQYEIINNHINHASGLELSGNPLMDYSILQNYSIKITGIK